MLDIVKKFILIDKTVFSPQNIFEGAIWTTGGRPNILREGFAPQPYKGIPP